jgi:membrane protease YdiL (CAAX protease family)
VRAFLWFLGLVLLAAAAVALLTYPAWLLLHPHFDFPFHRIGERIAMLAALLGFLALARRLQLSDRASLGYGVPRLLFWRELAVGLALGVLSMGAVVGLMAALGLLDWTRAALPTTGAVARLIAASALSGLAVALIEETFLRGAMYTAIARESGARTAVLLSSLLYAATHFFGKYHIAAAQVTPWSGVALLGGSLGAFAHPAAILDAFMALFGVGVLLGLVRVATGNIAACIGLHAGWVWVMLVAHELSAPRSGAPLGFLLSRFDGFVGWLVLIACAAMAWPLWRFYRGRQRS